jgi:hypothetical protein
LVTTLRNQYQLSERIVGECGFRLLASADLSREDPDFLGDFPTTLSLFLHRLTINEHVRNNNLLPSTAYGSAPLALDLHYLMTAWATSALNEQAILAWAMQRIHQRPVLDVSSLSPADWNAEDRVQVLPTDLTTEDIMRIWDSLQPSYRLSVAYVVRVVRIDPVEEEEEAAPVVATRFTWTDEPAALRSGGSS